MEFAILFIVAFLIGLAIYWWRLQWLTAVIAPMILFAFSVVMDDSSGFTGKQFSLMFGLPIVFFAALLGCYVVQMFFVKQEVIELSETEHGTSILPSKVQSELKNELQKKSQDRRQDR